MNANQPIFKFVDERNVVVTQTWNITTRAGLLTILPGFTSDGASVPDFIDGLPGFQRFNGSTIRAALAHDWFYAAEAVDRHTADEILRDILLQDGSSQAHADAFFAAVEAFGWSVWLKHTSETIANARNFGALSLLPVTT